MDIDEVLSDRSMLYNMKKSVARSFACLFVNWNNVNGINIYFPTFYKPTSFQPVEYSRIFNLHFSKKLQSVI